MTTKRQDVQSVIKRVDFSIGYVKGKLKSDNLTHNERLDYKRELQTLNRLKEDLNWYKDEY